MKVTSEHYEVIRAAVEPRDTPEAREAYRTGNFPRSEAVKDLDKRYRWDLFWEARRDAQRSGFNDGPYSDAHIDTALRNIVAPL